MFTQSVCYDLLFPVFVSHGWNTKEYVHVLYIVRYGVFKSDEIFFIPTFLRFLPENSMIIKTKNTLTTNVSM